MSRYFLSLLTSVFLAVAALAQTPPYTWQPVTDSNWNNATNWLDGTFANFVPVAGSTTQLLFNASGSTSYIASNDLGAFTLNNIGFSNTGTGLITIAGNDLVLDGTTPTFTVTGAVSVTNVISGTGPLTMTGPGTLTLSGASTFAGGMSMSAGTLALAGSTVSATSTAGFPTGLISSSPLGLGTLTMSGGTLTISGGNRAIGNPITYSGTSSVIDVPVGLELTTTGQITSVAASNITKTGSGLWRIADGGTTSAGMLGNLTINNGTVQLTDPTAPTIGGDLATPSITVNNGGTFEFGANPPYPFENPDLPASTVITLNPGGTAIINVAEDFGTVALAGGSFQLRDSPVGFGVTTAWQSGTISSIANGIHVIDGSIAINKTTPGTVTLTDVDLLTTGTLTITQGVIETNRYLSTSGTLALGGTTAGSHGTLRYNPSGAIVSMVLNRSISLSTGASSSGTIDVANPSSYVVFTGTFTGSTRPFFKTGPGTMVIASAAPPAYTSAGLMTVNNGTLRVNASNYLCSFTATGTGTLSIDNGAGTTTMGGNNLNLASTGRIQFDLNSAAPSVSLMTLVGTVTKAGTPTIVLTNQMAMTPGLYTLIDYGGAAIAAGGIALDSGRILTGGLIYNAGATSIQVNVIGSDTTKWTGAINSNWEVSPTNNWQTIAGAAPTNFIQYDSIAFDDSAAPNYTVNIPAGNVVRPSLITVNTVNQYTIQGDGKISGVSPLVKNGPGVLTILNDNDFAGPITINQGAITLGNGGLTGSVGSINLTLADSTVFSLNRTLPMDIAGLVTLNGNVTIDVSGTGDLSFASTVIAAGTVTKTGPGKLILAGNNDGAGTFTGILNINNGTVNLNDDRNGAGDLGASAINIFSGGKFIIGPNNNPDLPGTTNIFVNANAEFDAQVGEAFGGLTLSGGTFRLTGQQVNSISNTATYTLESGSVISTGFPSNLMLVNTSTVYTKNTAGTVTFTGPLTYSDAAFIVNEGTLAFEGVNTPVSGTASISLGSATTAATIRLTDASTVSLSRPVVLGAIGGEIEITLAGGDMTLTGLVSGGNLTKSGMGSLTLVYANTYTGTTTISAGTLRVNGDNTAATGAVSVGSGATLRGIGIVGGPTTVNSTGTIRGGNSIGTLTLPGGLTISPGGSLAVEIAGGDPSASPGGSTLGPLPTPISNSFIHVPGAPPGPPLLVISPSATFVVITTGFEFNALMPYSYVIAKGPNDQSALLITTPGQFTFDIPVVPGSASVFGDAAGNVYLSFVPVVPEPGCLLGLVGLVGFAAIRARRK